MREIVFFVTGDSPNFNHAHQNSEIKKRETKVSRMNTPSKLALMKNS